MSITGASKLTPGVLVQAAAGLLLCAFGYYLTHRDSYEVRTVLATAGGCNMPTDIYEPRSGSPAGSVILFHGLSANKKVMTFTAQEFANEDLRVFVPDLPGHGKAPGPFSPERAEFCAAALVRDLAARKAILPQRTILAGHSMGGALAARIAAQLPVAGVIAISPAPMHPTPEVSSELLLFQTPPQLAGHSLILSAEWEPAAIRQIAQDLVTASADSSNKYAVIPATSHVSILFAAATFDLIREWSSQLFGTSSAAPFPKNHPALGCLIGILGLAILTPPFLRETSSAPSHSAVIDSRQTPSFLRSIISVILFSILAVVTLHFLPPFRFLRIFQGDYLATLLFLVGAAALVVNRRSLPSFKSLFAAPTASAAVAALVLLLLFAAWFELTFHEAWLTPARWLRFPLLFLAFLPWHLAEEALLSNPTKSLSPTRLFRALTFRGIIWGIATAAIFYLHSGQFIFVLLPLYFLMFSILQRLAIDAVRFRTRSISAAAVFGAILLAGFVLAILPIA